MSGEVPEASRQDEPERPGDSDPADPPGAPAWSSDAAKVARLAADSWIFAAKMGRTGAKTRDIAYQISQLPEVGHEVIGQDSEGNDVVVDDLLGLVKNLNAAADSQAKAGEALAKLAVLSSEFAEVLAKAEAEELDAAADAAADPHDL